MENHLWKGLAKEPTVKAEGGEGASLPMNIGEKEKREWLARQQF